MDPLDKLEMILKGKIDRKKKEIERGMTAGIHLAYPYLNGIEHEKIGLEKALCGLYAVKRNAPTVSDEIVQKMYGSAKPV